MIIPPMIRERYANKEVIKAKKPFNLCRLNKISPTAKNIKIIPAKDIHIFSIATECKIRGNKTIHS